MNHTQELNSFLSVSDQQMSSHVPALAPQRSLSPNYNVQQQINSTGGGLGSYRRARAGTLPSRLYSSTTPLMPQGPSSSSGSSIISSSSAASSAASATLNPSSLNFDSLSISSQMGSNSLELPAPQTKTRLRSGSLLGLSESNSIWGVDAVGISSSSSNSHSAITQPSSLNTLIPHSSALEAPLQLEPVSSSSSSNVPDPLFTGNRARAYSTNNLATNEPNGNYLLQNFLINENIPAKKSLHLEALLHSSNGLHGNEPSMSALRPRAQTIQNGTNDTIMTSLYSLQPHSINEHPEQRSPCPSQKATDSSHNVQLQHQHHNLQHNTNSNINQPLLLDNIDPRLLNWTSTYVDSNLGPTNTIYISKLPSQQITPFALASVLIKFGNVRTVRLFIGNEAALVEYKTIQMAMQAKVQLNHQELLPGYPCLVTFAKILPSEVHSDVSATVNSSVPFSSSSATAAVVSSSVVNKSCVNAPQHIQINGEPQEYMDPVKTNLTATNMTNDYNFNMVQEQPLQFVDLVDDIFDAVQKLGIPRDSGQVKTIIRNALSYQGFDTDFGPLPEPILVKEYDAPKLREARKAMDSNSMSAIEVEELSLAMLDELPELASDYLGNTVVQKLFEFSSDSIKFVMLKEVSPYLAQMGIHKNGTWSAQKMINVADSPLQKNIVASSLKPYCVPLLNDQYGNYVIQCSLKFGSPWNDFIFEAILAKFWLIVQNRFGARAIRACLESHEATAPQTAIVSAAIILHARYLAVNQNSALLITWFLDTCTLPNRYVLLAPRLISHLGTLCTHKLASLTILKILNNRYEIEARNMIFNALFGPVTSISISDVSDLPSPPEVLSEILQDSAHGASFVQKIVSNSQFEGEIRKNIMAQVRRVLLEMNVTSYQGYKRLLEEVGLATSSNSGSSSNGRGHQRSHSTNNNGNSMRNKNRNSGNGSNNKPSNYNSRNRSPNGFRGQAPQLSQNSMHQFISNNKAPEFDYNHQQAQNYFGIPVNAHQQQYYENNQQPVYDQGYFAQIHQQPQYMQQSHQMYNNTNAKDYDHGFNRTINMTNSYNSNGMLPQNQHYFGQQSNGVQMTGHSEYNVFGGGN